MFRPAMSCEKSLTQWKLAKFRKNEKQQKNQKKKIENFEKKKWKNEKSQNHSKLQEKHVFQLFEWKKKSSFFEKKSFRGQLFSTFFDFSFQISIVTFLFGSSRICYRVLNIIFAEEPQITHIYEHFSENFIAKYFLEKILEYFIFCKKKMNFWVKKYLKKLAAFGTTKLAALRCVGGGG